jgi:hypothetical protein
LAWNVRAFGGRFLASDRFLHEFPRGGFSFCNVPTRDYNIPIGYQNQEFLYEISSKDPLKKEFYTIAFWPALDLSLDRRKALLPSCLYLEGNLFWYKEAILSEERECVWDCLRKASAFIGIAFLYKNLFFVEHRCFSKK